MDDRGKATEWKPGETGNPNGRPRIKPMTDELKSLLGDDNNSALKEIITKAISEAKKGDFRYFKEIMDRIDGKVIEQLELTAEVNNTFDGLSGTEQALIAKHRGGPGEDNDEL